MLRTPVIVDVADHDSAEAVAMIMAVTWRMYGVHASVRCWD